MVCQRVREREREREGGRSSYKAKKILENRHRSLKINDSNKEIPKDTHVYEVEQYKHVDPNK